MNWTDLIDGWKTGGLARELEPGELGAFLETRPSPLGIARVLAAHYYAGGDPVERAWRTQSDRYLELPDNAMAVETLALAMNLVMPEELLGVARNEASLELRLAPACGEGRGVSKARVVVRRVASHARRALVRPEPVDALAPRAFVYALNVLLDTRRAPLRFVPLIALPERRAWIAITREQAERLEPFHVLACDEPWRVFARFGTRPPDALSLAS
jgi:hypothetical protein